MHLQLLNHNCVPDAKNSCTRLGGMSKGFLLGGGDGCTGVYRSTMLPRGSLLSPGLSPTATVPTNYQMHFGIWSLSWLGENQKAAKLDAMPSSKFDSVCSL